MRSFKCNIYYGASKPLLYPVGEKVEAKYWNSEKQRCKLIQTYPEGNRINAVLDDITQKAKKACNALSDADRTAENVRYTLDMLMERADDQSDTSIHEVYRILAKRAKSDGRKRAFNSKLNKFIEFEAWQISEGRRSAPYQWKEFHYRDAEDFHQFLIYKQYAPHTIGDHVKLLKRVFRYAQKLGIHDNTVADDRDFKAPTGKAADVPSLDREQILKFKNVECETALQEEVRDIFYMQCILCLRFGDMGLDVGQLHEKDGRYFLRKTSFKTLTKTVMPVPNSLRTPKSL